MGFFDEMEPAPPPPPSYRLPDWIGPPENVIPATVALDVVLARTSDVAVWVSDALVFPAGLSFCLNVKYKGPDRPRRDPPFFGPNEETPRFGVELSDGRRVIAGLRRGEPWLVRPERPILHPRSGGGGGHHHRAELWLWPLPPAGDLTFVLEWPAQAIDETRVTVNADPIVAAAIRAEEMWPDTRPWPPGEQDVVI